MNKNKLDNIEKLISNKKIDQAIAKVKIEFLNR